MDRKTLYYGAVTGILLYGVFLFLLHGLNYLSASTTGFLQSTAVIIVPVLHGMIRRKMPERQIITGVFVVTIDLLLMNGVFWNGGGGGIAGMSRGSLCCLFSAFLYAVHILVTKRFVSEVDPLCLGIWQMGFAAFYALITTFLLENPVLPQTALQWIAILGLALVCSAYGFVMQAVLQKYVSPETMGFMFSLEPVFCAIFAFFLLHENMGLSGYGGSVLIFAGVLIANRPLQVKEAV